MKDLGLVMDSKLKFDKHIAEISRKATGVLASIKRTMTYIDRNMFIGLYKSLVRPLLETSVSVWNPYMVKHVKQLEAVQRRATKLVRGISQLSYNERLQALKQPTLQYRRKRGDMITTYKIFHGLVDTDPSNFFKINHIISYFIFHILNIFIQGTNSIRILFYNLALLKLKYLINYLQIN